MASPSLPSLYHRLTLQRSSNPSTFRKKCFSESWTLYSLMDLLLLCMVINLLSLNCNSFILQVLLIAGTIGSQLCLSTIFATRQILFTLNPIICDSWLLVAPLVWIILILIMSLSPRSLSIHLIGNKLTEAVYHYPSCNEFISALLTYCSSSSSKQMNIQRINAVNYYLQTIFHSQLPKQCQHSNTKILNEISKLHRNGMREKGIQLHQIVPQMSKERSEDYRTGYLCSQWMRLLYHCFPLQFTINIVYICSVRNDPYLTMLLLGLLLIYFVLEYICYKGHVNRFELLECSIMILPDLSTDCILHVLEWKETFESPDEMIEHCEGMYQIMFGQLDAIHQVMQTVLNDDIASEIVQFVWQ
eukprot:263676_1